MYFKDAIVNTFNVRNIHALIYLVTHAQMFTVFEMKSKAMLYKSKQDKEKIVAKTIMLYE